MWEVYFPWPITVEIFMSDFQRFFILENVGKIKNVKKRKKRDMNKKRKKRFLHLWPMQHIYSCRPV